MQTLDHLFENVGKILDSAKFKDCPFPVYRGHSNGSYNLIPTLLRIYPKTGTDIWTLENNLYSDFKALVGPKVKFESSWSALFAMRHEGIPTRLLDWTENIGMALFFALDAVEVKNPHIWILNPYCLNEKNRDIKDSLIDPEEDLPPYHKTYADYINLDKFSCHELPIAVYPRRSNERIFAQKGLFTIHGKNESSLDSICPDCLERLDLTQELIPRLRNALRQFGINKYSVYPDFKGLSDYLRELYNY